MAATEPIESVEALKKIDPLSQIEIFFEEQKDSLEQGKRISMYAIAVLTSEDVQRNLRPRIEYNVLTAQSAKKSHSAIFIKLQTEHQNLDKEHQQFEKNNTFWNRSKEVVSKSQTMASIGTFAYAAASASNPFTAAGFLLLAGIQSLNLTEGWDKAANPLSDLLGASNEKVKAGLEYTFGYLPAVLNWTKMIDVPQNPFGGTLTVAKMTTTYFDSKTTNEWEMYQAKFQGRMTKLKDKETQISEKLKTAGSASSEFKKSKDSFHISSEMLDGLGQ